MNEVLLLAFAGSQVVVNFSCRVYEDSCEVQISFNNFIQECMMYDVIFIVSCFISAGKCSARHVIILSHITETITHHGDH